MATKKRQKKSIQQDLIRLERTANGIVVFIRIGKTYCEVFTMNSKAFRELIILGTCMIEEVPHQFGEFRHASLQDECDTHDNTPSEKVKPRRGNVEAQKVHKHV